MLFVKQTSGKFRAQAAEFYFRVHCLPNQSVQQTSIYFMLIGIFDINRFFNSVFGFQLSFSSFNQQLTSLLILENSDIIQSGILWSVIRSMIDQLVCSYRPQFALIEHTHMTGQGVIVSAWMVESQYEQPKLPDN